MTRSLTFTLLIALLLLSGCTSKNLESNTQKESILSQSTFDVDCDNLTDYIVFAFSSINLQSVKSSSQRQLFLNLQFNIYLKFYTFNQASRRGVAEIL